MSEAQQEGAPKAESQAGGQPPSLPALPPGEHPASHVASGEMARILDVRVEASVELGRKRMSIAEVLEMAPNSVLEFLKRSDEPLDIRVNGRLIARGEAVVMGDRYGVRVTEIVAATSHRGRIEVGDLPK